MLIKAVVILFMIVIVISLGSGLRYLIKDKENSKRTVKALSWRIGLSLTLFIILFIGFATGLITPHGIGG